MLPRGLKPTIVPRIKEGTNPDVAVVASAVTETTLA